MTTGNLRKTSGKFLSLWGPPLLWAGFIYFLSAQKGLAIGTGAVDFWTRKPAHVGEYAVLFVLTFRAIQESFGRNWKFWEIATGAGVLSFLYSLTDELHQLTVPTRSGKLADIGFDLLGILAGILIFWLYSNNLRKKSKLLR